MPRTRVPNPITALLTLPSLLAPLLFATPAAAVPEDLDIFTSFEEFKNVSERLFLETKLVENDWNIKRTAESLGMQRSHLYKKIDKYSLK